jgi:hypothetical protein
MAMVGKLYALPNTQLTKRLKSEKRLLENDSILRDVKRDVDQTTSGLNFLTLRPRVEVLNDYARVVENIYKPENYYKRVLLTGLNLRPSYKYKPSFRKLLISIKSLFILTRKIGFNKTTGWLYWKLLFFIILKNPKAFEAAINLSAMFIHFHKHSKFVVNLTREEIVDIERRRRKAS